MGKTKAKNVAMKRRREKQIVLTPNVMTLAHQRMDERKHDEAADSYHPKSPGGSA